MNKAELIKGIEKTVEGLELIKKCLGDNSKEVPTEVVEPKVEEPKVVEEVAQEVKTLESLDIDVNSLKEMKYNDFKKFASQLGVKCTGTRDEIMERILALTDEANIEKVEEQPSEEVVEEVKEEKVVPMKKKLGKVKKEVKEEDEFDIQAKEIAEETDVEDIISALNDVGVKANKKNYVTMLASALRDGLIALDDEEDNEEVSDDNDTDEEEITANSYFSKYDVDGYNDPNNMTEARKEAIQSLISGVIEQIMNGQISEEDILSYLEDNCTDEEKDLLDDEYTDNDLIGFYLEMIKRTVDNDGVQHEPSDPYELNEDDLCCGHKLQYSEKTEKYICEICGTEYEAE